MIKNPKNADKCIEYILTHEADDYANWCDENNYDPKDLFQTSKYHVYANALLAKDLEWESE